MFCLTPQCLDYLAACQLRLYIFLSSHSYSVTETALYSFVFFLYFCYCVIMCVPSINGYDNLDRPIEISKYQHELDNCDYFDLTDPIKASHGDLLVMQLNIRGLLGKLSNLQDLVNRVSRGKKIDILLLCETWQN